MSHAVPFIGAAVPSLVYFAGAVRLWQRAGVGRGLGRIDALRGAIGFGLLLAIVVSPLHHWSERSFTMHMVEHELLMAIATPLIVLGRPLAVMLWAFPPVLRRLIGRSTSSAAISRTWRALSSPVSASILHGLAIWFWHSPVMFAAAIHSEPMHWLQHASFLLTGLLFWTAMFRNRDRATSMFCLFATAVHTGLIGVLLTFSPFVLYPSPQGMWGLTPLEDQQLGGLIMWIPGGTIYMGVALALMQKVLFMRTSPRPGS